MKFIKVAYQMTGRLSHMAIRTLQNPILAQSIENSINVRSRDRLIKDLDRPCTMEMCACK